MIIYCLMILQMMPFQQVTKDTLIKTEALLERSTDALLHSRNLVMTAVSGRT